jgi:hypothetical protein
MLDGLAWSTSHETYVFAIANDHSSENPHPSHFLYAKMPVHAIFWIGLRRQLFYQLSYVTYLHAGSIGHPCWNLRIIVSVLHLFLLGPKNFLWLFPTPSPCLEPKIFGINIFSKLKVIDLAVRLSLFYTEVNPCIF